MNIKTKLLKKIDATLAPFAVVIARALIRLRQESSTQKSILIIRPGGIGDAVLLIPMIESLKRSYPEAGIDILAEKRNSKVFSLCPAIRALFLYDEAGGLLKALRQNYDIVIDTEQWYRLSAIVAYFTKAPVRIGFDTNDRRTLFNRTVTYSQKDYEMDSFFKLAGEITENLHPTSPTFISIPEGTHEKLKELLCPLTDKKIVAIFPGGSLPEKRWPAEGFMAVARQLGERGYGVIVVGGKNEIEVGESIVKEFPDSLNLCGKFTLVETAALLKEAALLVTNDSGIMHLAAGLGTKTVSIFGPGNPEKWAPRGERHVFVSARTECSPCTIFGHIPPCEKNLRCIKNIRAEEVIEKALTLLKQDGHESN